MQRSNPTYGTILSSERGALVVLAMARYCTAEGIDARSLIAFKGSSARPVGRGKMANERKSRKVDEEFVKRINDYFEGYELVELLGITTEEIIEAFAEKIGENAELLEEVTNYGR
jgi:hypothetical protein